MNKRIYIATAISEDMKENARKALLFSKYALKSGAVPLSPLFYVMCLNEMAGEDSELIRKAGISILWFCDELWIFGDTVTPRMKKELEFCKSLNIRIKTISSGTIKKILQEKRNEEKY